MQFWFHEFTKFWRMKSGNYCKQIVTIRFKIPSSEGRPPKGTQIPFLQESQKCGSKQQVERASVRPQDTNTRSWQGNSKVQGTGRARRGAGAEPGACALCGTQFPPCAPPSPHTGICQRRWSHETGPQLTFAARGHGDLRPDSRPQGPPESSRRNGRGFEFGAAHVPRLPRAGSGDVRASATSEVGAGDGASTLPSAASALGEDRHEQAEPGVVRAACRARLPVPLQGASRLQGGAHRRDQGESASVAPRRIHGLHASSGPSVWAYLTGPSLAASP